MRGILVSFEGCDGTGKSTQISMLVKRLTGLGFRVFVTREPGGTPIGEAIRTLLLDPMGPERSGVTEALLYAASRAELVRSVLLRALQENEFVIVERFVDSTVVYQGLAGGVSLETIEELNRIATDGLLPDLTILLDAEDVAEIENRIGLGRGKDKIESRGREFQQKVRDGYRLLARTFPDRIKVVPSAGSPEEVSERVTALVLGVARELISARGER